MPRGKLIQACGLDLAEAQLLHGRSHCRLTRVKAKGAGREGNDQAYAEYILFAVMGITLQKYSQDKPGSCVTKVQKDEESGVVNAMRDDR